MICRHSAFAFVKKPAEQKNTPETSLIQGDRIMYSDVQNAAGTVLCQRRNIFGKPL